MTYSGTKRKVLMPQNYHIDRTLKMMSNAPTNAKKHDMSYDACALCQPYTDDSVF